MADDLADILLEKAYGPGSVSTADVSALPQRRVPSSGESGLRSYLPEQPSWLRAIQHNPIVSRFLGEALPLALSGLPGRAPTRLPNAATFMNEIRSAPIALRKPIE